MLLVTRARIVGQVTLGGGGGVCAAGYKGEDCWTGDARRWGGGYVLLVTRARIVGQVTLGGGGGGMCCWLQGRGLLDR